jgi:ElaB/YqjD/DUF883 family membrane-anchored ribosome-binding protein
MMAVKLLGTRLALNYLQTGLPGRQSWQYARPNLQEGKIMADTIRGKIVEAGNAVGEAANKVGHKIGEKAEELKDAAKEKLHKAQNRVDEADQKAKNAQQEACEDAEANGGSCGRS